MRSFKQFFEGVDKHYDKYGYRIVSEEEAIKSLDKHFKSYVSGHLNGLSWKSIITKLPPSCPREVTGSFIWNYGNLNSFENFPDKIENSINVEYNHLTSLVGSPRWIGGNFYCDGNEIKSLEGAPEYIGGEFDSMYFTDSDYREFIAKRKYKQDALSGTEDEAGLGSVIDVL